MKRVPRHCFVPEYLTSHAYEDSALGIGYEQTISQPYIVAFMTEAAGLCPQDKVLEIGTGSGYQAAILACICKTVFTIELIAPLMERAVKVFRRLHYDNIHTKIENGYKGWPEEAPFDCIIITAAPQQMPKSLIEQLKPNGKMIVPVGSLVHQMLLKIIKTPEGYIERQLLPVRFVPMVNTTTD